MKPRLGLTRINSFTGHPFNGGELLKEVISYGDTSVNTLKGYKLELSKDTAPEEG